MFFRNKAPKQRDCYAVNTGLYIGEFFVFMGDNGNTLDFLSLPKMLVRIVPKESYSKGIKYKILTYVATLPKDVYSVCRAQYLKNKHSTSTLISPLSS